MKSSTGAALRLVFAICVAWSSAAGLVPRLATDEEQLRNIKEVLWPRAYREQDADLLSQILADEFESIDASGARSTKTEELDYVRKNKPSYDTFRFEIRRLQVFENRTAVVSGTGYIETKAKGDAKGSKVEYQSSNVFIERGGRWQAIASHVSGVKRTEL